MYNKMIWFIITCIADSPFFIEHNFNNHTYIDIQSLILSYGLAIIH